MGEIFFYLRRLQREIPIATHNIFCRILESVAQLCPFSHFHILLSLLLVWSCVRCSVFVSAIWKLPWICHQRFVTDHAVKVIERVRSFQVISCYMYNLAVICTILLLYVQLAVIYTICFRSNLHCTPAFVIRDHIIWNIFSKAFFQCLSVVFWNVCQDVLLRFVYLIPVYVKRHRGNLSVDGNIHPADHCRNKADIASTSKLAQRNVFYEWKNKR